MLRVEHMNVGGLLNVAGTTTPGPFLAQRTRLGPSACMAKAISLMFKTMSVTSSRTPAIDENSVQHAIDLNRRNSRTLK
jgi:hypothetical protein